MSQIQTPTLNDLCSNAKKDNIEYEDMLRKNTYTEKLNLLKAKKLAIRNIENIYEEQKRTINNACDKEAWESLQRYGEQIDALCQKYNDDGSLKYQVI